MFVSATRSTALVLAALMAMGIAAGFSIRQDVSELGRLGELQEVEQEIAEHNQARNLLIQHLAKDRGGKIAHLRGYAEQLDHIEKAPRSVVIFTPATPGAKPEAATLPDLRKRIETDLERIESWTPPPLLKSHADMKFTAGQFGASRLPVGVMLAAALVTLVVWSSISLRNLPGLRAEPSVRPGRAPLHWLIPPANLYLPFVIMRDIWQGSDPLRLTSPQRVRLPVISLWWMATLGAIGMFGYSVYRMIMAEGVFDMTEAFQMTLYADMVLAAVAAATFILVASVVWNQSRRVELVENMEAQLGPRTAWHKPN